MRQDTKCRFAVNTMIDLALNAQARPVALAVIAQRQRVSLSSLEQVAAQLRIAGLVVSTRGPGGGYSLSRDAAAISVAAIVGAVETPVDVDSIDGRPGLVGDLSQRLDVVMQAHMAGIALADLLITQRDAQPVVEPPQRRRALAPRPLTRPIFDGVPNSVFALGTVMATAGAWPYAR